MQGKATQDSHGRWLGLVVSVLGLFIVGANNAFNVYVKAMKESFNLTETYGNTRQNKCTRKMKYYSSTINQL